REAIYLSFGARYAFAKQGATMIFRLTLVALFVGLSGAARADVMDLIAQRGAITIGHRTDAPPFSYLDNQGAPAGLAVLLCGRAADAVREELGLETLKIRHVAVNSIERFNAVREGRVDLHCGPATQTLSRRETLDFSIPYFIASAGAVFRAGPGAEIGALGDQAVGVLAGTTTEALLPAILAEAGVGGAELVGYHSHIDGLNALAAGEIAAYFGDQAILRYQLGRLRPATPLQFADEQLSFEPYALTMKRGESRLRLAVDRGLSRVFDSGQIYELIEETLGEVTLSDLTLAVYQVVTLPE
ncbi:MAG: amino acid ABC transporter substrate-binding protein, partial [Paracoccaceae bacterium]